MATVESCSARGSQLVVANGVISFVCSSDRKEGVLNVDPTAGAVAWKSNDGAAIRIPRDDIFGVRSSDRNSAKRKSKIRSCFSRNVPQTDNLPQDVLVLSVVERPSAKWHSKEYHLTFKNASECSSCCDSIRNLLASLNRPKNLLVFINPYAGKKTSEKVYEREVVPVFAAAGIRADVRVTQRRNEATEFVANKANDLSGYDGIVTVGGDGTFTEVVQGMMARVNGKRQPGEDIKDIELPITEIPAGSGNVIAFEATGAEDPKTSALHIACGYRMSMDAATAFSGDEMKSLAACLLSYGFVSDVLASGEQYRWLGPNRYELTKLLSFLRYQQYRGTITLWPASADSGHPLDGRPCNVDCTLCSKTVMSADPPSGALETELAKSTFDRLPDGSIRLQGSFTSIGVSVNAMRYKKCPTGFSANNHICNGAMDLTMVRTASRSEFREFLNQILGGRGGLQLPFVQSFRVRKFTFEPEEGSKPSEWLNDGEQISTTNITAYIHRSVLRVFGRGVPKA